MTDIIEGIKWKVQILNINDIIINYIASYNITVE